MLLLLDFVSDINSTYCKIMKFYNCWHEEILTSVGRITVFFLYILDFILINIFFHALCFPNIDLQKKVA